MKIAGFQKVTLLDYPGQIASTIFLPGCDLRCGFCHNPELVYNKGKESYGPDEIIRQLVEKKRFVTAVCITGGEPLLSLDIAFVRKMKDLGFLIKLDTNGFHPNKLKKLVDEKLIDYVAIDIKTVPLQYQKLTGCKGDIDALIESVRIATTVPKYEFRTTIIPGFHTAQSIRQIIDWVLFITQKNKIQSYSLQQFIPRVGQMISPKFDLIKTASSALLKECHQAICQDCEQCEIKEYCPTTTTEDDLVQTTSQQKQISLQESINRAI